MKTFTATGYLLNSDHTKILLIFHKRLGRWLPPGGHIDTDEIPHFAVLREVKEETGLDANIIDYSPDLECSDNHTTQIPSPFCMHLDEIPPYDTDEKNYYVDLSYILQTDQENVVLQEDEVDNAKWFTMEELKECDTWEIVKKIAGKVMK